MAYVTGTTNSLADLLSAIQNACTGNGWTLSGSVLHKGTCYVDVNASSGVIKILGGTGVDQANALTGAADTGSASIADKLGGVAMAWPASFEIEVLSNPDEVYVQLHYATNVYRLGAFGQSSTSGLTGSGNWYSGGVRRHGGDYGNFTPTSGYTAVDYGSCGPLGLFAPRQSADDGLNCGVDAAGDGAWSTLLADPDFASLFARQPNAWNAESIFIPVRQYMSASNGFIAPVLECAHARWVNIANLADGQIVQIGADRWKIYPAFRRGVSNQSGTSGNFGHAIRYDGP